MTKATNWGGDDRAVGMDNDDDDNAAIIVTANGRTTSYNAAIINMTIAPLDHGKQADSIGGGTRAVGIVRE